MNSRVFLQISDEAVRRALAEQLAAKGFFIAPDAQNADHIVIDEGPRTAELCRSLRLEGCKLPILWLGAGAEQARQAGADAGLDKPLRFPDLLRRLTQPTSRKTIALAGFELDASARRITDPAGNSLSLTEKETAILSYLAKAGDQAVAREELLGEVWGYADSATTHTVETHIYRLRRKLGENGAEALLVTEAGGYRVRL